MGNPWRHLRPEIYPIRPFRWFAEPISECRWPHPFAPMNSWQPPRPSVASEDAPARSGCSQCRATSAPVCCPGRRGEPRAGLAGIRAGRSESSVRCDARCRGVRKGTASAIGRGANRRALIGCARSVGMQGKPTRRDIGLACPAHFAGSDPLRFPPNTRRERSASPEPATVARAEAFANMQSTAPQQRASFRPFPLAFDHSGVITEEYNRRGVSPENPWLLLTSDAVVAALQKHILQVTRRPCRLCARNPLPRMLTRRRVS